MKYKNYNQYFAKLVKILKQEYAKHKAPVVTYIAQTKGGPFKVLISTILSLRTKDEVTTAASKRLFDKANTPQKMADLKLNVLEKLIYPVGFYKTKAKTIKEICKKLIQQFDSIVPKDIDTLLTFKGIGRKTANLVLTQGYKIPAICVDTHVHRISNRLGIIKTKNPDQSEFELQKILPKKYWITYNDLLVSYGQIICRPISPKCSECKINSMCKKIGVVKKR